MNTAIIFAGGTGKRMNTKSVPKQFLELHGKPVLIYTLEQFECHPEIDEIILVCLQSWIEFAQQLIKKFRITKVTAIVPGGKSGQESIFHGIEAAYKRKKNDQTVVLIHDGVRPLIDGKTISECISSVHQFGSAITTTPAIETIFINGDNHQVGKILNRTQCALARAPQCFYLNDIYEAQRKALAEGKKEFIDSATLMQYYGATLHMVNGPVENIKITTPMDFYLFRAILDAKEEMQIIGI